MNKEGKDNTIRPPRRVTRTRHTSFGFFLKDAVFGANDGIVSTFAVVAGAAGASLSATAVVVIGIASLFADAFSMATSNYLATKSDNDLYRRERDIETDEVIHTPGAEEREIRKILARKGYTGQDMEEMSRLILKNKRFWIDLMMYEELGFAPLESGNPIRAGTVTFGAFVVAGALPVLPYLFFEQATPEVFVYSIAATIFALFVVGALRTLFTGRNWLTSGFEMLVFGGVAALIAYGVGFFLGTVVV